MRAKRHSPVLNINTLKRAERIAPQRVLIDNSDERNTFAIRGKGGRR